MKLERHKHILFTLILLPIYLIFFGILPPFVSASTIKTNIKTILASNESNTIDPQLRSLARELQSVFRYSSYKLLAQNNLNLDSNISKQIALPGNRVMMLTPNGISNNRVTLKLQIYKNKKQIFQTVIQLRNKSSITVGGPKHSGGYLLFNIFASF